MTFPYPSPMLHKTWAELNDDERAAVCDRLRLMAGLREWLAENREVWAVLSFVVDTAAGGIVVRISPGEIALVLLDQVEAAHRARFRIECGIKDGRAFNAVQAMPWREFGEAIKAYVETVEARR